jgi:pyruvate/2-oxoglutarate dehydrogenase complex dihydrolipoamide acyltransferase (E2) component
VRTVSCAKGATTLVVLLLCCGIAAAQQSAPPAQQAAPSAPKPAQIDRNGVLMLVRSSLLALDHANKTGNYTVLRDIGAPGFQGANTAARLAEIFAKLRNDKVDLSGVAVIDPQLSLLPQIEANGMMRMSGFFPSVPSQVNFDLLFAPVDSQWRLFGISVNIGQSGPVAPSPPPSPAPAPAAKQPAAAAKPPAPAAKQPPPAAAKQIAPAAKPPADD